MLEILVYAGGGNTLNGQQAGSKGGELWISIWNKQEYGKQQLVFGKDNCNELKVGSKRLIRETVPISFDEGIRRFNWLKLCWTDIFDLASM